MLRLCLLALAVRAAAAPPPSSGAPENAKEAALAAELAVGDGRDAEALERSQAALDGGYETAALRLVRAQALQHARLPAQALAEADRALELNPDSAQGRAWRGRALLALHRDAEGLDDLRRAADMDRALAPEYRAQLAARAASPWKRRLPWAGGAVVAVLLAALALRRRHGARLVRFGSLISMPAGADELREGSVLAGRFVVGKLLERGPWGQAHEGRDLEDRTVTLLRFAPAAGGRRAFSAAAAQAAAALKHPGLSPLEAAFEHAGWGVAVRAASRQPTVADELRQRGGPLPAEKLAAAGPVCEALDAAHAAGLIHGGLTARCLRMAQSDAWALEGLGLPPSGPAAPEPPEGGCGTREADLYALACALYEAAAGAPPFSSEAERREGRPAPLSGRRGVPPGLDAFFARALQPDPARRFKSAAELRLALLSVVAPAVH
jgi:hypothetical protein